MTVIFGCRPTGSKVIQYGDNSGITFRNTEPDLNEWEPVGDVACDHGYSYSTGYSASANRNDCYQKMRKSAAGMDAEIIVLTHSVMGREDCPGCVSFAGTAYRRIPRTKSAELDAGPTAAVTSEFDDAGAPDAEVISPASSVKDRLRALEELKQEGLVTDEEYESKRKAILDEL